ncbi:Zinc-binding alcohol dehydrogenase domain-containing protein 2, partial [Dichanthelium oligosanthes]
DICINCAGIGNKKLVYDDTSDGARTWRHAVNVNLVAVIDGTRIAFVQTNMAEQMNRKIIDSTGGYLKMEDVVNGAFELIQDESKAGACLWITKRRGMEYWPTPEEQRKYMVNPSKSKRMQTKNIYPSIRTPEFFEKIVVHTLSHNFRSATRLARVRLRLPIEPHSALVKIIYAGVNASDVNFSSGRYFSGTPKETASRLPFDAGFEGVGIVASVGDSVNHIKVGTPVALMTFGSYAEFTQAGQMTSGQVVLVTAAAGGTGQFAVQVLKTEFPRGVDIIYESVGGEMFDLCLNALAVHGHLIVIGMISQAGFFLVQYAHLWQDHLDKLFDLYASGKLKVSLDPKKFLGVASVPDAVEYLHSGKSVGKVVVCIDPSYSQIVAKL